MKSLNLNDLWLVLSNMVAHRLPALNLLHMGALYEVRLRDLHARIGAIPEVQSGTRPLVSELAAEDVLHDALGRGIHHALAGYEALEAFLPDEVNAHVSTLRAELLPSLGDVTAGYADEANAARRRKPRLDGLSEPLEAIPVAGLGTMTVLAERFTLQGERIDALLNKRAEIETESARQQGRLRFDALALMTEIRQSAELQIKAEKGAGTITLPDNIMGRLLGYATALVELREAGNTTEIPNDTVNIVDTPPQPTDV